MLIDVKGVLFWVVLMLSQTAYSQVTFVIETLPKATPANDTIYISGTFNGWKTNEPTCQLRKRLDGKYAVTLPLGSGTFEYKFTRGDWLKTETKANNEYRPNRIFTYNDESESTVYVKIENWQDLGGAQPFDFWALYFFAIAFQGLICIFLLYRIKNYSENLVQPLAWWIAIISLFLFGRGIYEIVSTNWQIYLVMAAQVMAFMTGPLLLRIGRSQAFAAKQLLHFIPALIVLALVMLKSVNYTPLQFLSHTLLHTITIDHVIFHGFGIIHNLIYLLIFSSRKYEDCKPLLYYGMASLSLIIIGWAINFYLLYMGSHSYFVLKFDLPLLLMSIQILTLTWLAIKKPDLFKVKDRILPIPEIEKLKEAINRVMEIEKPYRKSDLSLNELSEIVCIKPHLLSKVINEGFNYNFRDFVNKYRVEEFIRHINSENYKNYTYLAVAYEVGFNAKSTFNVAFKRFTQTTPREYFKKHKDLKINQ